MIPDAFRKMLMQNAPSMSKDMLDYYVRAYETTLPFPATLAMENGAKMHVLNIPQTIPEPDSKTAPMPGEIKYTLAAYITFANNQVEKALFYDSWPYGYGSTSETPITQSLVDNTPDFFSQAIVGDRASKGLCYKDLARKIPTRFGGGVIASKMNEMMDNDYRERQDIKHYFPEYDTAIDGGGHGDMRYDIVLGVLGIFPS